ncbi:MAG: transposase [Geminicoccaceae bacterium]|jgi:hypothetical protein|nr:transposase [Geminicoccaceae bacterium]
MIGFAAERLMALEVQALTGPGHGERSPSRLVQRNGYRDRDWRRESGRSSCASPSSCAYRWRRRIESGQAKSITDVAEQEGVTDAYVCRLLPLTCLAPDISGALGVTQGTMRAVIHNLQVAPAPA